MDSVCWEDLSLGRDSHAHSIRPVDLMTSRHVTEIRADDASSGVLDIHRIRSIAWKGIQDTYWSDVMEFDLVTKDAPISVTKAGHILSGYQTEIHRILEL